MAPSLYCLLCEEDNESIRHEDSEILWDYGNDQNLEREYSVLDVPLLNDECLDLLIKKECEQFVVFFDYFIKLKNGNFDLISRQEAVDWIIKVHAYFNFGPVSAYLAINYLDIFLAVYELPAKAWMMQLLGVSCLSLAIKMEETEIPLILDLQVGGSRFKFEAKTIQKMELLVMTKLKWRMQAVTPFSFIDGFICKVSGGQPVLKSMILTSTQLILGLIRGIEFLEFRPSEIAAAVSFHVVGSTQYFAIDQLVQKERVLKCVELLKELDGGCTRSIISGTSTSMAKSPIGVLDAACLSYITDDSKKRRLNHTPFDYEI